MTLTDRIAKKLFELNEVRACGRVRRPWESVEGAARAAWGVEARFVLGVIREPTVEMGNAGGKPRARGELAPTIWKAMIDAALAEGEGR